MRKKDPVLLALGKCPRNWNTYLLKTYGLPQEPQPRDEVSETAFTNREGRRSPLEDLASRQIKPYEEPPTGLLKVWGDYSGLENEPSEQWKRSQAFMRVIAWIFACKKTLPKPARAELLKHVDDLRPDKPLPVFDKCLGTPEEFLERWKGHELDVRFVYKSRGTQMFEIWYERLPPDEPEDLDEAEEPSGHWDGLKWMPTPTET